MPTDEKLHELLTEAAARLVYVDENTDAVALEGALEEVDRAQRLIRVDRRDAVLTNPSVRLVRPSRPARRGSAHAAERLIPDTVVTQPTERRFIYPKREKVLYPFYMWGRRDLNPRSTGLPGERLSAPEGRQRPR